MNNYLPLEPMGMGTIEIEQFHSYFYRFAQLHSTTMTPMTRHLGDWWRKNFDEAIELKEVYLYKANRLPLCGYTDSVLNYVKVVTVAANQPNLYRTTLLPIRAAADVVSHGALRRGRAWCPACMYWSQKNGETYYDRLLWTLAPIRRCPLHQLELVSHCPDCGKQQLCYHPRDGMTICAKCSSSLVQQPGSWRRERRPGFGETDCVELVTSISDGSLTYSAPKAFMKFCEELRLLSEPFLKYRQGALHTFGPQSWRMTHISPMLPTMLRRCHMVGVRLVDVLVDPLGAARAAGQLAYSGIELPLTLRPRRSPEVAKKVRAALIAAVARHESAPILSFKAFARSQGVSTGFIVYREPELATKYQKRASNWFRDERKRKRNLARSDLTLGSLKAYLTGEFSSQDELADHLCRKTDVKKHVARLLVSLAIKKHLKAKRLSCKKELTLCEKAYLWRGKRAGYL